MSVTIKKQGQLVTSIPTKMPAQVKAIQSSHPEIMPEMIEMFGRMDLSNRQIAAYYKVSPATMGALMRRQDLRQAYDRGRVEAVIAIRQTQMQLALGDEEKKIAPSERMLIHAGVQFGEQTRTGPVDEIEDYAPSDHTWDVDLKQKVAALRQNIIEGKVEDA